MSGKSGYYTKGQTKERSSRAYGKYSDILDMTNNLSKKVHQSKRRRPATAKLTSDGSSMRYGMNSKDQYEEYVPPFKMMRQYYTNKDY